MLEFILEEDKASPFLWCMHIRAFASGKAAELMGASLEKSAIRTRNQYGEWYVDEDNWKRMSESTLRRIQDGSLDSTSLLKKTQEMGRRADRLAQDILDAASGWVRKEDAS